jgi:hypothetical protein
MVVCAWAVTACVDISVLLCTVSNENIFLLEPVVA